MANKRDLKKSINYIAGELFAECVVNKLYVLGTDAAKADELMSRILKLQDEFLSRISHPEPGNVKGSFKKLKADFNAQTGQLIDELSKLKA